jgi:hypothetical protein
VAAPFRHGERGEVTSLEKELTNHAANHLVSLPEWHPLPHQVIRHVGGQQET